MEQWIKDNVPSLTDLLKRGRARRKLNAESDAASDVEKAGEVDDEGEEVNEDGEMEAKQPTKRKSYIRENYRESCWWNFGWSNPTRKEGRFLVGFRHPKRK